MMRAALYRRAEWDLLPLLAALRRRADGSTCDVSGPTEQLYGQIVELISSYEDVRAMREHKSKHVGVTVAQWAIIELLSFFMFLGIVLLRAGSARFEYFVCVLTSTSIALLSMITADLDSPFHGLIKVQLQAIETLITLVDETMLQDCIVDGKDCDWVHTQESLASFKEARRSRRVDRSSALTSRWKAGTVGRNTGAVSSRRERTAAIKFRGAAARIRFLSESRSSISQSVGRVVPDPLTELQAEEFETSPTWATTEPRSSNYAVVQMP